MHAPAAGGNFKRAESPNLGLRAGQKPTSPSLLNQFMHNPSAIPAPLRAGANSRDVALQQGLQQIMQKADMLLEYGNNVINKIDKGQAPKDARGFRKEASDGNLSNRPESALKVIGRKVEQVQQIARQSPGISSSEARLEKLRKENERLKAAKSPEEALNLARNRPNELGLKFHLERAGSAGAREFGGIAGSSPLNQLQKLSALEHNYESPGSRQFFELPEQKGAGEAGRKAPAADDEFSSRIGLLYDKLKELPPRVLQQPANLLRVNEELDEDFPLEERIKEIDQLHEQKKNPSRVRGEVIYNKYREDFQALKENYKRAIHIRPEEYSAERWV